MRVRFGAILCLILGAVLIRNGMAGGDSSTIGIANPCMVVVGTANGSCPVATLTLTENTDANGNATASPPQAWTVHLSSTNCFVSESYASEPITNGGTLTYSELYVYNFSESERCQYTITEDQVDPYTAGFDPPPPYSFGNAFPIPNPPGNRQNAAGDADAAVLAVTLKNTAKAPVASSTPATPTPTKTRTQSTSATASATETAPSEPSSSTSSPVSSASAAPVLASTGPHQQVRGSLIAGIALVLLGGVLLIAGRRPRRARHT